MKKVNWLIEKDIYDRESEFLAELQKQGYIYQEQIINISPMMIVFYSWKP